LFAVFQTSYFAHGLYFAAGAPLWTRIPILAELGLYVLLAGPDEVDALCGAGGAARLGALLELGPHARRGGGLRSAKTDATGGNTSVVDPGARLKDTPPATRFIHALFSTAPAGGPARAFARPNWLNSADVMSINRGVS
jgi:hypothetical protein